MHYDRDNVCQVGERPPRPSQQVCKGLFGGGGVANFEFETFMLVYTPPPLHCRQLQQCTRS